MLFATRPTGLRAVRPGRASLAALLLPAPPEAGRSARRAQIEDEAVRMDLAFLRRDVAGNPGIVARRRQRKPTLDVVTVDRIVWSVDFDDATARNDLFDWLADRIDRWEDWIELAYASGADRLTRRLLSMVVIVERRTRLLAHLG